MFGFRPLFCFSIALRSFGIAASGAMNEYQEHYQENREQLRIFIPHDENGGDIETREVDR